MIFNFMLPDEVIRDIWGPILNTAEEKEAIENIFHTVFLTAVTNHFKESRVLQSYVSRPEMVQKIIQSMKQSGEILSISLGRMERGGTDDQEDIKE